MSTKDEADYSAKAEGLFDRLLEEGASPRFRPPFWDDHFYRVWAVKFLADGLADVWKTAYAAGKEEGYANGLADGKSELGRFSRQLKERIDGAVNDTLDEYDL